MNKLQRLCCLALSAALLSGCAGGGSGAADAPESAVSLSFETTDMDGNAVTSGILSQSRLTMVNVWATYCGPCLREMPDLGELAADYAGEDFQLIGVISDVLEDDDASYAATLIEQTGADYTHLLLNESIYTALLTDVSVVPTTFFIDDGGAVLDTVLGSKSKTEWKEMIDALLEEQ